MRLGDDIDDHCPRCKRTLDHSVVSMVGDEVAKVRCRTCNSEHKYQHNKSGKKEMTAKEAFDKLVASMPGSQTDQPASSGDEKKKKKR
jgi:hypothetical protein